MSEHAHETEPVWLPDYKLAAARSLGFTGWIALGVALARELAGETAYQRAREQASQTCRCPHAADDALPSVDGAVPGVPSADLQASNGADDPNSCVARDRKVWLETLDARYRNIRRCC